MSIIQAINNPEMLVGLILVLISVVGLVGRNISLGTVTLSLRTARGLANALLLAVGLLGIGMILRELVGT
jgi:hypothetical protein